ncbi:MAG: hypothetical protein ACRDF0_01375 [Candidatus Limnocylindria bacterium]
MARRALAALTGVAYGLGLGPLVAYGEVLILAWVVAVAMVPWGFLALFPEVRRGATAIVVLAYGVHLAAASLLYFGSLAMGLGGFITGDDAGYSDVAWKVARIWGGEDVDIGGDAYLLGTFVYLEGALYALFGERPLLMIFLNAGLATALGVLASEIARHLFGTRAGIAALVLVAFFPSLVLWSALNLKEALTLFLIAVVFWALLRFHMRVRWPYLGIAFLTLLPLQTLRSYIFLELAVIIVIAVAVVPGWNWSRRATGTALAAALSGVLMITAPSPVPLGTDPVADLEQIRSNMAEGARTGFQDPADDPADESDERTGESNVPPAWLRLVNYLPIGIGYMLFAPFPWSLERTADVLAVPEMLLWYLLVGAALVTLWVHRASWQVLLPVIIFVGGTVVMLGLVEGNVGTLFRHRGMVIPFVAVLASPSLVSVGDRFLRSRVGEGARSADNAAARTAL